MTTTKHVLATSNFFQDWTDTGQITTDDNWSGVASIVGYRGDNVVASAGTNPQLATGDGTVTIDVNANRVDQGTFGTGGVAEFELANPVVAMQGSGTADAPHLVIYLDATGRENIVFSFKARDIDSTADNVIQQVAVQYRVGGSGAWTDLPAGYISDATTGPSLATLETTRTVTLPAGANNAADLQIRIITADAVGTDEWVGIDDISVTSSAIGGETQTVQFDPTSVTHAEGDAGATLYTFTVTRTGGTTGILDFSGTIAAGSTDSADYTGAVVPTVFSGSIAAGQASATVTVSVNGDYTIEPSESFTLTLTSVNNQSAVPASINAGGDDATGNITNDDAPGTISVADTSLAEGDAGTTAGSFTVSRTGGASGTVSVDYVITLPGGAGGADGSDVSGPLTGTVTFLEGETSATIPFTVNGDVTNEPNETFTVALSNAQGGASIGDGNATATITNDDAPPVISIGDASHVEGDDGVVYLVFTVSLSKPSIDPVTVDFETSDGTALEDSDYLGLSGQLTFAPGDTSETISVPIIGDDALETNETVTVTLSNPSGASIGDGTAAGTITNDDSGGYYSLAGGSFSQNWNNNGLITADDNWTGVPFIIGYLGDIDPAGSSTNVDPRTLTGADLGAVDVIANQTGTGIANGGVAEFHLTDATVALQGSGTADAPSIVLYMDATGRTDIVVQATLRDIDGSGDNAAQQINVQYRTTPGGAWSNAPLGYFPDVTTGGAATQTTPLNILLPADANNAATLEIRIMTTNAAGSDEWVGIDDIVVSSQAAGPVLSIANAAVFEGDAGPTLITFTVTRSGTTTGAVTADYAVVFGSGPFDAETDDFTALSPLSGQVSFADGETSTTITLSVDGDVGPEVDENFTVALSNASPGTTIGDGTATGTIVNDDATPPLVTVNDVSVVEGNSGSVNLVFTVSRTGGTGAFDVDFFTTDITASSVFGPGQDYVNTSGTVNFLAGEMSKTISVPVLGDLDPELSETFRVTLLNATNFAVITDDTGIGTIASDDAIFIHDIQGAAYFSPILAGEGVSSFNIASTNTVIVRAIVTAIDNDGARQGFYIQEEITDWDSNTHTSEAIFVMTRNDDGVGADVATAAPGVAVGAEVTVTARVMEYQENFASPNMPITVLTNASSIVVNSTGNVLPTLVLGVGHPMPTAIMTLVQPDHTDSADGIGDSFDASLYALSFWETVEGMHVTIPDMVVADGFVSTSGGQPFFQAYSQVHADADQINSRGGYTIAGDPPIGPPDTAETVDDTITGGRHLSDGDINPDIIEVDFTGFAEDAPVGFTSTVSMGDYLGDLTGIIEFDRIDRKLYVTDYDPGDFVDNTTTQETTLLGADTRALTVATFNVENLDPGDPLSKFQGLAEAIANNLNLPDIISIEEMQDNNGAAVGDGIDDDPITPGVQDATGADASQTWQMLVDELNALTGANYQWVDEEPDYNAEGGEPSGNIRVGFLYNTDRVQLGDLDANATLAERRQYTDRIGDSERDGGDLIAFDDDMLGSEIQTGDWSGTRRSLLGEFTFNGNTVYVAANHFPAKTQSDDFWDFNQNPAAGEPTNAGWTQRNNVAQDVYAMMNLIEGAAPGSGIVSGGDFNDFYFYRPLTTVTGYTLADGTARVGDARFDNLTLTLPEAERYTYNFDGRSQAIDHIIVNGTLSAVATYDVVHLNTGFNPADTTTPLSDHDPGLASFDFREFSERLLGTAGADLILGFGGDDTIFGLGGADILSGGSGVDVLDGGGDDDRFFVDAADIVIEASGQGSDRVFAGVSYALLAGSEVETLSTDDNSGTAAIDLTGNDLGNLLIGNDGANRLIDGGGQDILVGRGGADILIGGAGDLMDGGDGDDWFFVNAAGAIIVEALNQGNDRVFASADFGLTAGAHVEILSTDNDAGTDGIDLIGNELGNTIYGNAGDNILNGYTGADFMVGRGGNDSYFVDNAGDDVYESLGGGNDRVYASTSYTLASNSEIEILSTHHNEGTAAIDLTGNEQDNIIFGNAGANVIDGKGGSDYLVGFDGSDTYAFTSLGGGNVDTIVGFSAGADTVALDDAVFTGLAMGELDGNVFVVGSAAQDANDRIIFNQVTGALLFDADGTGAAAAIQFATLTGDQSALSASDFQVI